MRDLLRLIQALVLVTISSTAFARQLGVTAFSITPFTTQTTVRSVGETAVRYTVTNNANTSVSNLSLVANWHSSAKALSLSNDTCSGQTLNAGQTCTFDIVIPGHNQASSFTLTPKVCGFNGMLCSQAANTFTVNVVQNSLPTRVYEVVFPSGTSTEQLVGINVNNTSDVIRATIDNPSTDGPLVVSPDGSKVYMLHNNGDATFSVLVFNVSATALTQSQTSYTVAYEDKNLNAISGQMAITPDGHTLYITDGKYSGTDYPVYRVDLTASNTATAVTGISDATPGQVAHYPKAIVISPDGSTVYFATSNSDENYIFSFANALSTTSVNTIARVTDLTSLKRLLMSSDGSVLYAGGQLSSATFPAAFEKYDVADNLSLEATFSTTPDNGNVFSASLSTDNTKIFTTVNNMTQGDFLLYTITTANMTAPAGETYPHNFLFFMFNFNAITCTPDGSNVAMLNYGSSGNLTALFPPASPSNVTTVNPAADEEAVYSHTDGSFSG